MILVDTSAWIDFFRGNGALAHAVDDALGSGEAALCGPIVTELRRGLKATQRKHVIGLLAGCHYLDQPDDLWSSAGDLGAMLGRRGHTVKTLDLLIAAHALAHQVPLLTADRDFDLIAKLTPGLFVL